MIVSTLLDLGVVTLLASVGWLMAPISLPLIGAVLALAVVFLVGADLLKVSLMRLAVLCFRWGVTAGLGRLTRTPALISASICSLYSAGTGSAPAAVSPPCAAPKQKASSSWP